MKRSIVFISCLLTVFALSFTSCEGPAGEDGNDSCVECHNSANMSLKSTQYETSAHAAGGAVARATSNSCSKCHSNEGFLETIRTGRDTTAVGVPIPTRVSCETCHSGTHETFDEETDGKDYKLTAKGPVTAMKNENVVIDLGSSSNLCVNCHQPRTDAPVADDKGEAEVNSSRYGPHHGPQGNLVYGVMAYEGSGSVAYPAKGSSAHAKGGACVMCHMGESEGDEGGHTFKPSLASCTECHTDATNFDINGVQTEVAALLDELEANLIAKGLIGSDGKLVLASYPVDLTGALFNFKTVQEDRSMGIHNPAYIKALLKNSIAASK